MSGSGDGDGELGRLRTVALFGLGALLACQPTGKEPQREAPGAAPESVVSDWLVDVTVESGVDFIHTTGGRGELYLPEIMGGGIAAFDADGDGRVDLYFTNQNSLLPRMAQSETEVNRFYRQTREGRFVDATEASGLGDGGYGMGATVGDVDNDGDPDVYVSNAGPDRLYVNDGAGHFRDGTLEAGIRIDGLTASAAFLDYDNDGDLDLYVTRYVRWDAAIRCTFSTGHRQYCGPKAFPPASDRLLRNEGGGRFVNVSEAAGIGGPRAAGLGVVVVDFDRDGWPDIYVANDGYANNLWVNQRDGRFVDDALMLGAAFNDQGAPEAGMGVLAGDLDGDGIVDLFMTHLDRETNTLYRGLPGSVGFLDGTATSGLGRSSWHLTGFGTVAFDIELDGDLDLAIANGRVKLGDVTSAATLQQPWSRLAESNLLFLNDGRGVFSAGGPATTSFTAPVEISRGLIAPDLDSDGDRDIVVANIQGSPRIYRNEAPRTGSWLQVRVLDPSLRRDAIGARVGVDVQGRTRWRTIRHSSSYLSSEPPLAHFSLESGQRVEAIRVEWPGGPEERFEGGPSDRRVTLRKGEGRRE